MKKNLITMLLITILLSTILSTVYANDNFFIIIDQTREAYKKANYEAVMSYLNKMNEIVKSKVGNDEPEAWETVKSWKGNGLKNTESFIIKSDEWRIIWTNKGMLLQIFVNAKNGSTLLPFYLIGNTTEPGSDVSYFYKPGEYYLNISGIGEWSVIVEEKGVDK